MAKPQKIIFLETTLLTLKDWVTVKMMIDFDIDFNEKKRVTPPPRKYLPSIQPFIVGWKAGVRRQQWRQTIPWISERQGPSTVIRLQQVPVMDVPVSPDLRDGWQLEAVRTGEAVCTWQAATVPSLNLVVGWGQAFLLRHYIQTNFDVFKKN